MSWLSRFHLVSNTALVLLVSVVCSTVCGETDSKFRSAFLGPHVWQENMPSAEVDRQLQRHFAAVLDQLNQTHASSLLKALRRWEASSANQWTKPQRRAALVMLVHNRQLQLDRLNAYMLRGRFPLNEGQADRVTPVFVDRHQTHCAVAYLMHNDGQNGVITNIVADDNLFIVGEPARAKKSGLANWIRTSGLTFEEVALIQPGYPITLDATFEDLITTTPVVETDDFILSDASIRGSRFNATLPDSFANEPNAIQAILDQGQASIETNDVVIPAIRRSVGVLFGTSDGQIGDGDFIDFGTPELVPSTLEDWLYLGSNDAIFGALVGQSRASGNVGIVEIDYRLRSKGNAFSQIALTSPDGGSDQFPFSKSNISGEQSALLILSQIYHGETSELLGESRLFVAGTGEPGFNNVTPLVGSSVSSLSADFVRIRSYGLVVGGNEIFDERLHSFFHEFQTSTVPEPGVVGTALLMCAGVVFRRRRSD